MLTATAVSNTSGKSVTTLIRSIGLFHGHEMVAPRLHDRPRRDSHEAEQPLPVVGAASRDHERSRHDPAVLVHDEQPGLRREHRARILDEWQHRHLPPLPVRLTQPPDYAGRWPSTPAFLRSERTVSVGRAPFPSHARARSASTLMSAGLVRGL